MSGRAPATAFLDRDGTLMWDTAYVSNPADVRLIEGAAEAVLLLNRAGVPVVIVTNQSGIGRGYYTAADFEAVQARLQSLLAEAGARIDATFVCPHAPADGCQCRKPGLGLYEAAAESGFETAGALYVGDRPRDVLPALALGGLGMLVVGRGGEYHDRVPEEVVQVPDLLSGIRGLLAVPGEDP